MAWIEVHQSLPGHKKTMACAEELGISEVQMVGHLVVFWLWAIDNSTDGSLPGVTPRMIAKAAMWDGDCNALCNALCHTAFLHKRNDHVFVIHDWQDYAGKLTAKREANRERQRRHRERKTAAKTVDDEAEHNALRNGDITVTSPSRNGATVQYSTVQNNNGNTTSRKLTTPHFDADHPAMQLAEHLRDCILARDGSTKVPDNLQQWAADADRLLRLDKRGYDEAMWLIDWCQQDPFWCANILSMAKFRKQYDQLKRRAMATPRQSGKRETAIDRMLREEGIA